MSMHAAIKRLAGTRNPCRMSTNLPSNEPAADSYLRFEAVKTQTGLSRTTVYRLVKAGSFPVPKQLGPRAVGWLASDLARWRKGRPDARADQAA